MPVTGGGAAAATLIIHTAPVEQLARALELARARGWQPLVVATRQPEGLRTLAAPGIVVSFAVPEKIPAARVVLLYNDRHGYGYRAWRRRVLDLPLERWTMTPDGVLAELNEERAAAEDWHELKEKFGRIRCRVLTPPLAALAWRCWRLLARGGEPPAYSVLRTLLRETRGLQSVIRFVRLLHVLAALAATGEREAVDIGTGDGILLRLLRAGGWGKLVGVDREFPVALQRWSLASSGAAALQPADLETWSPPAGSRCLVACEVLEHLHDDRGAVRRWTDALVPGGTLIIHVPYRDEPLFPGDTPQPDHVRTGYTPDELRDMMRDCGLTVTTLRWTLGGEASRLGWLDRRLERWPFLQHLARPELLALALADLFADHASGHGLMLVAKKRGALHADH